MRRPNNANGRVQRPAVSCQKDTYMTRASVMTQRLYPNKLNQEVPQ